MNMACIVDFIRLIDSKLNDFPDRKLVLCVASGKRELTNAVFLLESYMILKQDKSSDAVDASFRWLGQRPNAAIPRRHLLQARLRP
jgi:hypothetical protein